MKNERFKFSSVKPKEAYLAEALRKVTNFIRKTEIWSENTDASKKAKTQGDRNVGWGDKKPRLDIRDSHFTTNLKSILMEVKGHLMLRKP